MLRDNLTVASRRIKYDSNISVILVEIMVNIVYELSIQKPTLM